MEQQLGPLGLELAESTTKKKMIPLASSMTTMTKMKTLAWSTTKTTDHTTMSHMKTMEHHS